MENEMLSDRMKESYERTRRTNKLIKSNDKKQRSDKRTTNTRTTKTHKKDISNNT